LSTPKFWAASQSSAALACPFKVLTDYFAGGDTLDQFLEEYPSVTRERAVAAIEEARLTRTAQLK
jgi:uncharacterized protein (DUF433 family)